METTHFGDGETAGHKNANRTSQGVDMLKAQLLERRKGLEEQVRGVQPGRAQSWNSHVTPPHFHRRSSHPQSIDLPLPPPFPLLPLSRMTHSNTPPILQFPGVISHSEHPIPPPQFHTVCLQRDMLQRECRTPTRGFLEHVEGRLAAVNTQLDSLLSSSSSSSSNLPGRPTAPLSTSNGETSRATTTTKAAAPAHRSNPYAIRGFFGAIGYGDEDSDDASCSGGGSSECGSQGVLPAPLQVAPARPEPVGATGSSSPSAAGATARVKSAVDGGVVDGAVGGAVGGAVDGALSGGLLGTLPSVVLVEVLLCLSPAAIVDGPLLSCRLLHAGATAEPALWRGQLRRAVRGALARLEAGSLPPLPRGVARGGGDLGSGGGGPGSGNGGGGGGGGLDQLPGLGRRVCAGVAEVAGRSRPPLEYFFAQVEALPAVLAQAAHRASRRASKARARAARRLLLDQRRRSSRGGSGGGDGLGDGDASVGATGAATEPRTGRSSSSESDGYGGRGFGFGRDAMRVFDIYGHYTGEAAGGGPGGGEGFDSDDWSDSSVDSDRDDSAEEDVHRAAALAAGGLVGGGALGPEGFGDASPWQAALLGGLIGEHGLVAAQAFAHQARAATAEGGLAGGGGPGGGGAVAGVGAGGGDSAGGGGPQSRCVLSLDKRCYDATPFLNDHPGGTSNLMR